MFTGVGGFELGIKKATNNNKSLPQKGQSQKGGNGNSKEQEAQLHSRQHPTFRCVGFSENDKFCSELLRKRFPDVKNYGDARDIKTDELPDFDFLVAGFPCQAFSIAGKRKGFEDTRGTLFHEIARILEAKRPNYLLLENVKGLLNHDRGKTFGVILATLSELGYIVQWMVLNSKFFGVPQNRERVFIIGSLRGEPIPEILPVKFDDTKNAKEDRFEQESESWISTLDSRYGQRWSQETYVLHNIYGGFGEGPRQSKDSPTIRTPKGGGHIPMIAQSLQTDGQLRQGSSWGTNNPQSSRNIRRLTPMECERLQGFPDNWTEGFSDTQRYKMMGNAVTVNVVEAIMRNWK